MEGDALPKENLRHEEQEVRDSELRDVAAAAQLPECACVRDPLSSLSPALRPHPSAGRGGLRIFDLLMRGDSCNCELGEKLRLPPNLLSHHLRVLRRAGLVRSRRDAMDGRRIYYAVHKEVVIRWRAWFNAFLDPARIQERPVLCGPEGQQAERRLDKQ